jgi:outer membrane immunogenic protein
MFRVITRAALAVALTAATATVAAAQTWTGPYLGGTLGAGLQMDDAGEVVTFDTGLDGMFGDTIRTAAGADAFSPGFCGGLAMGPTPGAGCTDDDAGIDAGGRAGYDWQRGMFVVGALVDVTRTDVRDGVSAFSTTPAFYAFSRELQAVGGLRARVGFGTPRVFVYGTGGGAWGRVEHQFTTSNGVNTFVPGRDVVRTESAWGYQAGGGLEVRLGGRWSLTGEYVFTSLDDAEDGAVRSQGPAPATNPFILVNTAGTDLRRDDRFEFQALRAGLSYRF